MDIKKLRLQQAWSQEQLAECSGLSVRTVQRLENGGQMSLESRKSIAAAFDIDAAALTETDKQPETKKPSDLEQQTLKEVKCLKKFYTKLLRYGFTILFLLIINLIVSPDNLWVIWPALGWGILILWKNLRNFLVSTTFDSTWERQQVKKRMENKDKMAS